MIFESQRSVHLVRGEVPQAGQGSPHQLPEGGVGTLPAGMDCGEQREGGEKAQDLHDELRCDVSNVTCQLSSHVGG